MVIMQSQFKYLDNKLLFSNELNNLLFEVHKISKLKKFEVTPYR